MDGLLFLLVAALLAPLAVKRGLRRWRRLSGDTWLEPGARGGPVAVRAPVGAELDPDGESPSTIAGARRTLDSPNDAAAVLPDEPASSGQTLSDHPSYDSAQEVPEENPQPREEGIVVPPSSVPAKGEATASPLSQPDGGGGDRAETALLQDGGGEPLLEIAHQRAGLETDGAGALPDEVSTGEDLTAAATAPPDTVDAGGHAYPPAAEGEGNPREESISDDLPPVDQVADLSHTVPAPGESHAPGLGDEPTRRPGEPSGAESGPDQPLEPLPQPPPGPAFRPRQAAVHRDRRGKRRQDAAAAAPQDPVSAVPPPAFRPPSAEIKLRLSLHPIHRTARLSVVLTRPEGFPEHITVQAGGSHSIVAYNEQRYDDLDLPWTRDLLEGELRLVSAEGLQWLRSARRVHIFAGDPLEPELISVGAARAGTQHTLICRSGDAAAVRLAAASTGSPELQTHDDWQGVPEGWMVQSGYVPVRAAVPPLASSLRPLDPGEGLEIIFDGGLSIRQRVYAAGHPPQIAINPPPGAALVTIGGAPAELSPDGAWIAPGWDAPGQHVVDVVPGPSATYEIAADPWTAGGWDFWDAYPDRFGNRPQGPWARAKICGARIQGPANETVIAAETQSTLVALGAQCGATPLRRRPDVDVSVGLAPGQPAFLLSAAGLRRTQGHVIWLGLTPAKKESTRHDADWGAAVRIAAARRLALDGADADGENAWRKAKAVARRKNSRRRGA